MRTISSGNPVPPSIARNILAPLSFWEKCNVVRRVCVPSVCTNAYTYTHCQIVKIREIPRDSHRRYNNRDISRREAVSLRYEDDDDDDDDMGPPERGRGEMETMGIVECDLVSGCRHRWRCNNGEI